MIKIKIYLKVFIFKVFLRSNIQGIVIMVLKNPWFENLTNIYIYIYIYIYIILSIILKYLKKIIKFRYSNVKLFNYNSNYLFLNIQIFNNYF